MNSKEKREKKGSEKRGNAHINVWQGSVGGRGKSVEQAGKTRVVGNLLMATEGLTASSEKNGIRWL